MSSSLKSTAVQPSSKKSQKKLHKKRRQELLVHGYINQHARIRKLQQGVPHEIMNLIYSFYEYQEIALALIGASQSGKSTLATRILQACGKIPSEKVEALQQTHYSFFMDTTTEERQKRLTMHGSCAHSFDVGRLRCTLLDTPGHHRYLHNATRLLSMADAAVLVIPVDDSFDACMQRAHRRNGDMEGRARLFARLCIIYHVDQLIVAFNKLDTFPTEIAAHERFVECKQTVNKFLKKLGFKVKRIPFVPVSALYAHNLNTFDLDAADNEKSAAYLKWYRGFEVVRHKEKYSGFSLFDALRDCIEVKQRIFSKGIEKDFKMSVFKRYRVPGVGVVFQGKIIHGSVQIGDQLRYYPMGERDPVGTVRSIDINYQSANSAECGVIASLCVHVKNDNRMRPPMLCLERPIEKRLKTCRTFTALVYVVHHPHRLNAAKRVRRGDRRYYRLSCDARRKRSGKDEENSRRKRSEDELLCGGYTPNVSMSTWRCPCVMEEIEWLTRGQQRLTDCEFVQSNDTAQIVFRPLQPMIVFTFEECEYFGRMVVLDNFNMVMMGKVASVQYDE